LQLGNGGSTGSIVGNVSDNGTLAFDNSGNTAFAGTISGSGGISQIGAGTTTLTALNPYTGTTTISAGTLALSGNGSLATSSNIADNAVFDVSAASAGVAIQSLSGTGDVILGAQDLSLSNAQGTFSGVISGTGSLTLTSGTEILTGDNTYTGTTTVRGGTLIIDGSATSSASVKVSGGGTIGGVGILPSTTIGSGATLAAGDQGVGTLHVNGTASFASGANFDVYVSKAAASELVVSGSATLGGTLSVVATNGYPLGQKLTVLSAAGGVSGSFTLASATSTGGNFSYKLSEDANNVYLEVDLAELSSLLPSSATRNQTSVTAGIDTAIAKGDTLPSAFENLGSLSSGDLGSAATQLSGEIGSDVPQAGRSLFNAFVGSVFDHITDLRQASSSQGGSDPWLSLYGGTTRLSGDTALIGSHPLDGDTFGIVGGQEWTLSPVVTLGAVLSGGTESFSLGSGLGKGRANAFDAGGYGYLTLSPHIYGAFLLALGVDDVDTRRVVTVSGTDTLTGQVTAFQFGARYETGVNFDWATPYFATQTQFFDTPSYQEKASSGSSVFALSYAAHNANATRFELGLDRSDSFDFGDDGMLALTGRLAWAYDLTGSRTIAASFATLPGSGFTVQGASPDTNSGLVSLGANFKTASGIGLVARFDGDFAQGSQTYLGTAGLNFTW
jgi:autotransporter-associated beta strand protein